MFLCEGGVAYHMNIFGLHEKQHIDRGALLDGYIKNILFATYRKGGGANCIKILFYDENFSLNVVWIVFYPIWFIDKLHRKSLLILSNL